MTYAIDAAPLWRPNPQTVAATRMAQLILATGHASYADLWQWSIDQPEAFWSLLWDFCGAVGEKGTQILVDRDKPARDNAPGDAGGRMLGARWFPEARLNYAENLLQRRDDGEALVFWGEDKVRRRMSRAELYAEVARFQQFLIAAGVGEGDRVAGYLPNLPETLIAMLALRRSAPSGRRRRRISASRAYSTASARSSPRCWSASMVIGTTASRSTAWRRMLRWWRRCRRC